MASLIRSVAVFGDGTYNVIHSGLNLYRAMLGSERPDIGWLSRPYGTFDNIPLLERMYLEKGRGLNLTHQQWDMTKAWNPDSNGFTQNEKLNWLTSSENGTDMVLSYDPALDIYRQHTPEVSGGAIVNVLGIETSPGGMQFARIQCWNWTNPFPMEIPYPLGYVWTALYPPTPGYPNGKSYTPRGGVRFITQYWRDWAYLPLDWLEKI